MAAAFLGALPPEEVLQLLERRAIALEAAVAAADSIGQTMARSGIPRLFGVEGEHALAMRRAELAWVRQIIEDVRSGKLEWPPEALQFQWK